MARKSPYDICLSQEEKEILEKITRKYTSAYQDVVRAKVVLYASKGFNNEQIGQMLDLPRQIVSKWRKRFFYERIPGLKERPRHGRPRVFSPSSSHRDKSSCMSASKRLGIAIFPLQ